MSKPKQWMRRQIAVNFRDQAFLHTQYIEQTCTGPLCIPPGLLCLPAWAPWAGVLSEPGSPALSTPP